MNKKHLLAVVAFLFQIVTGCATQSVVKDSDIQREQIRKVREQASAKETAALNFFKLNGFAKSSELFREAAESYKQLGDKTGELRALVASTKALLWADDRQNFLAQIKEVKGHVGKDDIPVKDIRFLINLGDKMEGLELSYPLESGQEEIFE